jgi:hypothetical protein
MTTARKSADDKPFDFNLDAVKSEVELTPFRIHWSGQRFEFLHLQELDAWELAESASGGEQKAMLAIFRLALGEDWKAFRAIPMPGYKLNALWSAYEKHCGIEPGESQGSTGS